MTSLILGKYWSSDDGEGSSPSAVSRQLRKSSGMCASSLIISERFSQARKRFCQSVKAGAVACCMLYVVGCVWMDGGFFGAHIKKAHLEKERTWSIMPCHISGEQVVFGAQE